MKSRNLTIALLALVGLAACSSTGQLTPQAQQAISVACTLDKSAPAAVATGGVIISVVVPQAAPDAAIANQVDPAVHALIQQACANALPGSTAAAVSTQPLPVTVTPPAASAAPAPAAN